MTAAFCQKHFCLYYSEGACPSCERGIEGLLHTAEQVRKDGTFEALCKTHEELEQQYGENTSPDAADIRQVCYELGEFLVEKNTAYGSSALEPLRIMSKADPIEQIKVRMDDKLSRLVRGQAAGEDAVKDFVGYWVLLQVAERRAEMKRYAAADEKMERDLVKT